MYLEDIREVVNGKLRVLRRNMMTTEVKYLKYIFPSDYFDQNLLRVVSKYSKRQKMQELLQVGREPGAEIEQGVDNNSFCSHFDSHSPYL